MEPQIDDRIEHFAVHAEEIGSMLEQIEENLRDAKDTAKADILAEAVKACEEMENAIRRAMAA